MNDQALRDENRDGQLTMRARAHTAIATLILDLPDEASAQRCALLDAIKVIDALVA